jgi:LysM repeat protein
MRSALRAILLAVSLAVATAPPAVQAQRTATTYVVRAGDTLYRISQQTGVSVSELRRLNGLASDLIEVGQVLRLSSVATTPSRPTGPGPGPATSASRTHVVQPGETLFRIAGQYGTTVDELRRVNGIVGDRISSGSRLTIPSGRSAGGPAALPAEIAAPAEPPPITLGPWRIDDTTVPADVVHFVEPGETLFSIAVRYGFSSDAIAAVNRLSTAPLLPGTMLVLPRAVDPSVPHELALPRADSEGRAIVYDRSVAGRTTASGEAYDPEALTAAHRDVPLGTVLLVTSRGSGRSVFVRVNDRGPMSMANVIELSAAAAEALEMDDDETEAVELRHIP